MLPSKNSTGAAADPYAALRIAPFRAFILVRFLMTVGVQIQGVAVGLQIYKAMHDTFALGLIGLAEALPSLGVALFAGHVADVRSRKTIALCALSLLCVCSISLFAYAMWAHDRVLDPSLLNVRPIYAVIWYWILRC